MAGSTAAGRLHQRQMEWNQRAVRPAGIAQSPWLVKEKVLSFLKVSRLVFDS